MDEVEGAVEIDGLLDQAIDVDQVIVAEIENIEARIAKEYPELARSIEAIFRGAVKNARILRQVHAINNIEQVKQYLPGSDY